MSDPKDPKNHFDAHVDMEREIKEEEAAAFEKIIQEQMLEYNQINGIGRLRHPPDAEITPTRDEQVIDLAARRANKKKRDRGI